MITVEGRTGAMRWAPAGTVHAGRRALHHRLTIRGQAGAVLWGHRTAAVLGAWTITRHEQPHTPPVWQLAARVTRADAFQTRQRPLLFTAHRDKGQWCWAIESLDVDGDALYATLGQPEQ